MPKVRLIQCLCPKRHCIVAIAYVPGVTTMTTRDGSQVVLTAENVAQAFRATVEEFISKGVFDQWCSICKSHDFHYEDGETRFTNLEDAEVEMRKVEAANRVTRQFIQSSIN